MVDTTYRFTRNIGNSYTLYAGQIAQLGEAREVGALLRFSDVDSTQLADFESARLRIFHRSFTDSLVPPSEPFTLERINPGLGDTIWTETDTNFFEFPSTDLIYSAVMKDSDSVLVFLGSQSIDTLRMDYLEFAVGRQLLLDWRSGVEANNGFLLRAPLGSDLVSFYSSESTRRPYLVVDYFGDDTTEAGDDTTSSSYYLVTQDISVYPTLVIDIPDEGRLLLNRSDGHRVHIDFKIPFDSLEARPIAGGRLVFNVDQSATMMLASTMVLEVWLRNQPIAQGDSGMEFLTAFSYQAHTDSMVYNLTSLLEDYQNGVQNHGFDLLAGATNHDFDRLTLFDPRLEIIYAVPFGASQ
ncbi:MAG: DNRLRE domain-containing protein [Candidatus Marinimicrobia bacterium]|nr:DNRLRE domain-containing protein [Candidatus Neomarinimicrobiota bacterium]